MFTRRDLLKAALACGTVAVIPPVIQSWAERRPEEPLTKSPRTVEFIERLFPDNEWGRWEQEWLELRSTRTPMGRPRSEFSCLVSMSYVVTVPLEF